jgi:hypothetical protein
MGEGLVTPRSVAFTELYGLREGSWLHARSFPAAFKNSAIRPRRTRGATYLLGLERQRFRAPPGRRPRLKIQSRPHETYEGGRPEMWGTWS